MRRKTPNNGDNILTKSSTQRSQSSIQNTLEITNKTNKTDFYNIDNDNDDVNEPFEHRQPTIKERLNHIPMS